MRGDCQYVAVAPPFSVENFVHCSTPSLIAEAIHHFYVKPIFNSTQSSPARLTASIIIYNDIIARYSKFVEIYYSIPQRYRIVVMYNQKLSIHMRPVFTIR